MQKNLPLSTFDALRAPNKTYNYSLSRELCDPRLECV